MLTQTRRGPLGPPLKWSEGDFRFLCPHCREMRCSVNPRTNLAHCFCCENNFNNIDVLVTESYTFHSAVEVLEQWLKRYQANQSEAE